MCSNTPPQDELGWKSSSCTELQHRTENENVSPVIMKSHSSYKNSSTPYRVTLIRGCTLTEFWPWTRMSNCLHVFTRNSLANPQELQRFQRSNLCCSSHLDIGNRLSWLHRRGRRSSWRLWHGGDSPEKGLARKSLDCVREIVGLTLLTNRYGFAGELGWLNLDRINTAGLAGDRFLMARHGRTRRRRIRSHRHDLTRRIRILKERWAMVQGWGCGRRRF